MVDTVLFLGPEPLAARWHGLTRTQWAMAAWLTFLGVFLWRFGLPSSRINLFVVISTGLFAATRATHARRHTSFGLGAAVPDPERLRHPPRPTRTSGRPFTSFRRSTPTAGSSGAWSDRRAAAPALHAGRPHW